MLSCFCIMNTSSIITLNTTLSRTTDFCYARLPRWDAHVCEAVQLLHLDTKALHELDRHVNVWLTHQLVGNNDLYAPLACCEGCCHQQCGEVLTGDTARQAHLQTVRQTDGQFGRQMDSLADRQTCGWMTIVVVVAAVMHAPCQMEAQQLQPAQEGNQCPVCTQHQHPAAPALPQDLLWASLACGERHPTQMCHVLQPQQRP